MSVLTGGCGLFQLHVCRASKVKSQTIKTSWERKQRFRNERKAAQQLARSLREEAAAAKEVRFGRI